MHRFASAFESAYLNEGSAFARNGERRVIECLRAANFRVAFDVGANDGDWTIEALNKWPQCNIHAFEVAPPTFQRLRERIAESPLRSRCVVNGFGLSDRNGNEEMFYFPEHPDLTCDRRRHDSYQTAPFEARLCTGDSYAEGQQIETLDFVKIDVEGAENRVLSGLAGYISRGKVNCLQFEYGAFSIQTRVLLADYYALMAQNYWIGKIFPTDVEFRDYDWRMEDFRFANYCCVSKARPDLRKLLH